MVDGFMNNMQTFKLIKLNNESEVVTVSENLKQVILDFPTTNASKQLDVILDKEGTEVEILGVYVGTGDQKINLEVNAIHKVPNTKCLTQIRGVLKDNSYSSFKGMIKIEKPAQKTNSYLDDDVLVLGDSAKNESQPMLEIEADDVKATHGATTGRILDEHLFYLTSRGLTKEQAERIIVEGFLEPVISKILDKDLKEEIYNKALVQLA